MRNIFLLIFIFCAIGCNPKPSLKYTTVNSTYKEMTESDYEYVNVLYPDTTKGTYSSELGWSPGRNGYSYANSFSNLVIKNENVYIEAALIETEWTLPAETEKSISREDCTKETIMSRTWNRFVLRPHIFNDAGDGYTYKTNMVYIIKNGVKTGPLEVVKMLKVPTAEEWNQEIKLEGTTYDTQDKLIYYRIPYVCRELEGVILEVGGLYRYGKQLPILRFKLNYEDWVKEAWAKQDAKKAKEAAKAAKKLAERTVNQSHNRAR